MYMLERSCYDVSVMYGALVVCIEISFTIVLTL